MFYFIFFFRKKNTYQYIIDTVVTDNTPREIHIKKKVFWKKNKKINKVGGLSG